MDSLSNWNPEDTPALIDEMDAKINEIIIKINEIVTWINSQ